MTLQCGKELNNFNIYPAWKRDAVRWVITGSPSLFHSWKVVF